MNSLMVIMMEILRADGLETNRDLLMVKFMALIGASNWYILMVKCLTLYLKM